MSRRMLPVAAVFLAGVVVLIAVFSSGGNDDGYRVRAIFNNAFGLIPGEDVKIAGVKVGTIESMDINKRKQAVVVLKIEDAGFQDFRKDAHCRIRPQSLIGEKFIECSLTEPTGPGEPQAQALAKIPEGEPGEGQVLLPVTQTSSSVDLDLINNVMERPYQERLALIINELGTGLAGRGEDLNLAIRRSNPALEQTDKVLKALADQNIVLADLARDTDKVMAPLADRRREVADLIEQANATSKEVASQRGEMERSIELLPEFLDELKPTMTSLEQLTDQLTPVATDLNTSASDISRMITNLDDFSDAGVPAFETLADATAKGEKALDKADPVIKDLRTLSTNAVAPSKNLQKLLTSFEKTGGTKRFLETFFYFATSSNGYDSLGHYQRVFLIANNCINYTVTPLSGCSANFDNVSTDSKKQATELIKELGQTGDSQSDDKAKKSLTDTPVLRNQPEANTQLEADSAMLNYLFGGS